MSDTSCHNHMNCGVLFVECFSLSFLSLFSLLSEGTGSKYQHLPYITTLKMVSIKEQNNPVRPRPRRTVHLVPGRWEAAHCSWGGPGGRTSRDGKKAEQEFTATSGLRVRVCVCSVSWSPPYITRVCCWLQSALFVVHRFYNVGSCEITNKNINLKLVECTFIVLYMNTLFTAVLNNIKTSLTLAVN